jgi:hypothetical protein
MIKRVKYSRTMHVPWSPGTQSDDRLLPSIDHLLGEDCVITEKRDGENTNLYTDGMHARSLDSQHHESRNWIKAYHGTFAHDIPVGWRICGENLYAKHSIYYENLPTYFEAFSVWNEQNERLHWDDQQMFLDLLGIRVVPVLFRGVLTMRQLELIEGALDTERQEGYVITTVKGFHYDDFGKHVAKWVRPKHVQTDKHWMTQAVVPNKLK